MKLIHFILLLCLAASCSPKVAPSVTTEVRDTTIIKEVPRYITVTLPGDTVTVVKQIECDENKVKPVTIKKKSGKATLTVTIDKQGTLHASAACDSLTKIIEAKDREISRLRTESRKETVVVTQYRTRHIDIISRCIAGAVVLTIAAYTGWKIFKPKFL